MKLIKDLSEDAVGTIDQDACLPIHLAIDSYVDDPDSLLALIPILISGPCAMMEFYSDKSISPPLTYAIQYGYSEDIIMAILEVLPDGAKLKDPDGMLPLHRALLQFATQAVRARLLPHDPAVATNIEFGVDDNTIYVMRNPDSWAAGDEGSKY